MTIRILVNGANGKMGQPAVAAIQATPDFILCGTTGRTDNLAEAIQQTHADVVLDLTRADCAAKNLETIITAGARAVIGTSGLTEAMLAAIIQKHADKNPIGIIAPNFSLGAVLMMKYARELARHYAAIEIIEMHHDKKADSPSGTAIRTAELLAQGKQAPLTPPITDHEIIAGARGARYQDIAIHSVRLPGLIAHQQIIFGSQGETLTVRHDTLDRSCFMPGIVLACRKVMLLNNMIYGLENIL